jgi:hypothetical protein
MNNDPVDFDDCGDFRNASHHVDWAGQKGYIATAVGGGCILGVALASPADEDHLQDAYDVFAAEAHDVDPEYAPETVNTDDWGRHRGGISTPDERASAVV